MNVALPVEAGHLYDFPKYYDIVFGSDWKAELDFITACSTRYAGRKVQRIFEPACGTGRLMIRLAKAGYQVAGNDLSVKAVAYCNDRLARHGFPPGAVVGDMADFRLERQADLAHCMINSFRHLDSEQKARAHLRCVADALAPGGLYLLGLHLTPTEGEPLEEESWSARRGNLAVVSRLWTIHTDRRRRREKVGMTFDVYTPSRGFRLADELAFRTYTARQMAELIRSVENFEVAATHDFAYDINRPIRIGRETEDVVYVLRKR